MIAIQSAGSSNIVQHLFSAYNYEFDWKEKKGNKININNKSSGIELKEN